MLNWLSTGTTVPFFSAENKTEKRGSGMRILRGVAERSGGQTERTCVVGKKASAKNFQEFMLAFFISFHAQ
jgi:hypothetical protein